MAVPAPPPAPPAPAAPPVDIAATENVSYRKLRPVKYPPQAIRQRHEGEVILRVLVGADGTPKDIQIEKSSGFRELDRAAMDAAKTWVFNPGQRDGHTVEGWALVPFKFNLNEL